MRVAEVAVVAAVGEIRRRSHRDRHQLQDAETYSGHVISRVNKRECAQDRQRFAEMLLWYIIITNDLLLHHCMYVVCF